MKKSQREQLRSRGLHKYSFQSNSCHAQTAVIMIEGGS